METIVFRNQSETDILDSVDAFEKAISQSQIIMFPGASAPETSRKVPRSLSRLSSAMKRSKKQS